jgi:ribosome-associated translation inhibitor RaiA
MTKTTVRQRRSPQLRLEIAGDQIAPSLRTRIDERIRRAFVGVRTSPVHTRVTFADVNGPKGGVDIRCAIDVQLPRTALLHATATADRPITAFNRSADVITRQIARKLLRREESGRRPKKYYAARRLLWPRNGQAI